MMIWETVEPGPGFGGSAGGLAKHGLNPSNAEATYSQTQERKDFVKLNPVMLVLIG